MADRGTDSWKGASYQIQIIAVEAIIWKILARCWFRWS